MRNTVSRRENPVPETEGSLATAPQAGVPPATLAYRPGGQADRLRRRAEFLRDLAEAKELRTRVDRRRTRIVDLRDQRGARRLFPYGG